MSWRLLAIGAAVIAAGIAFHALGAMLQSFDTRGARRFGLLLDDTAELMKVVGAAVAAAALAWVLLAAGIGSWT